MTAQATEVIHYQGHKRCMCTEPLADYFELAGIESPFDVTCSALWRGYVGEWEINEGRLYLLKIDGSLRSEQPASLEAFFPGFPDRVFAHWYSGQIRLPQGELLEYFHGGYGGTYAQDLLIDLEKGLVTQTAVRHNGSSLRAHVS